MHARFLQWCQRNNIAVGGGGGGGTHTQTPTEVYGSFYNAMCNDITNFRLLTDGIAAEVGLPLTAGAGGSGGTGGTHT